MKVAFNQFKHHLRYTWWKVILLYVVEVIFLCTAKSVHCIYYPNATYTRETDMSFLILFFVMIPILVFSFQQFYTWYHQGAIRWQLIIGNHLPQVLADIFSIAVILSLGYLLFFSLYYRNSMEYLSLYVAGEKLNTTFWQCVEQQSIISSLLSNHKVDILSLVLLSFQIASLLIAGVMALCKNVRGVLPLVYLVVSLCVCFLRITYTTTIFQNSVYSIFIIGNIVFALRCWKWKKEESVC